MDETVRRDYISQTLQSATTATFEAAASAGTLDDQLPPPLRSKGLILGSRPVPVWPVGRSRARDGREFIVDQKAVNSLLADGNSQQFVPFTYSHEEDPLHGADNSGYMLHFCADDQFVYADRVAWTAEAARSLASGARGPVSPDAYCESLDPATLEVLTPDSALFDSESGQYRTNTFRPMFWRAASLVGVPALKNLPPASLGAERTTPRADQSGQKENYTMSKYIGLIARSAEALSAVRTKAGLPETATTQQVLAAAGQTAGPEILGILRKAMKFPDAVNDDLFVQFLDSFLDQYMKDKNVPDNDAPMEEKAAGELSTPGPAPVAFSGDISARASAAVSAAIPQIVEKASEQVRQQLAAQAAQSAIDAELLDYEKTGKLVAAERDEFRKRLSDPVLAQGARQQLAARSTGPKVTAEITSGGLDPSISVDNLPRKEAEDLLSRAVRWAFQDDLPLGQALAAVRDGNAEEQSFHQQLLKSNPGLGTGKKLPGAPWQTGMRRNRNADAQLDAEKLAYIGSRIKLGALPQDLVPPGMQKEALRRVMLAGEVSSYQPGTKFQVPGFGYGYATGTYGGSEIAPEVTGGANEQASYPIYGTEKRQVSVNASGVPEPVARNVDDIETSYWGVDWKTVTLRGYSNQVKVDRRDQAAGDAVLPLGVMASATEQALTIEKNKKEIIQAAAVRLHTNYTSGFYKDLSGGSRQWSDPSSTPIQDWQGARVTIWRATGAFPDTSLIPPDVVETLRFHKDLLLAAQYAGMGDASRPNAMVPIEMLYAIFGRFVTPTVLTSVIPGGASADTPWGQDVILAVTSKGQVVAPRAFVTVVSSGYPIVKTAPEELAGLQGRDVVKVSDMYMVDTVVASGGTTKSAFLFKNACPALTVL